MMMRQTSDQRMCERLKITWAFLFSVWYSFDIHSLTLRFDLFASKMRGEKSRGLRMGEACIGIGSAPSISFFSSSLGNISWRVLGAGDSVSVDWHSELASFWADESSPPSPPHLYVHSSSDDSSTFLESMSISLSSCSDSVFPSSVSRCLQMKFPMLGAVCVDLK